MVLINIGIMVVVMVIALTALLITDTAMDVGIMGVTMYTAANSAVIKAVAVWIDGGNRRGFICY